MISTIGDFHGEFDLMNERSKETHGKTISSGIGCFHRRNETG
jgi:hypothetical protein